MPDLPVLFALAADISLRRLPTRHPGATIRAYADGIALVTRPVKRHAKSIMDIFSEYERASGLGLNIKNVVVVPLWLPRQRKPTPGWAGPLLPPVGAAREVVAELDPRWRRAIFFTWSATYLGFDIGSEAREKMLTKALTKYNDRVELWAKAGLGLHCTVLAYNVYIPPLAERPTSWHTIKEQAFSRLIPGPGNWLPSDTVFRLKDWRFLSVPRFLVSLAKSAKLGIITSAAATRALLCGL